MKKIFSVAVITLLAFFVCLTAQKASAKNINVQDRKVTIQGATPDNPVVSLGKAFDKKSGKMVEGIAIIHYAKSAAKPGKPSRTACYGFIAKGAKWKGTPESWTVDSVNDGDLGGAFLKSNIEKDITKWETAAGNINILGEGSTGTVSSLPGDTLDDRNEVTFASIQNQGVIAVTTLWGYFGGPAAYRELVEWDQIYSTNYKWSKNATDDPTSMDFENIATHELGHSVGMDDLYNSNCSTQTMYGYANFGETDKRSLEAGDIEGINLLY